MTHDGALLLLTAIIERAEIDARTTRQTTSDDPKVLKRRRMYIAEIQGKQLAPFLSDLATIRQTYQRDATTVRLRRDVLKLVEGETL